MTSVTTKAESSHLQSDTAVHPLHQRDGKPTEWRSSALRAYQRRTLATDALIASAYLAGTNTRRVRRALKALFAGAVGKDTVSRVGRKVKSDWDAWNARSLAEEPIVREVIDRYIKAYAETVDWIYSDPEALRHFREYSGTPEDIAKKGMAEFYKKEMLDPYRVSGLDAVMSDAISLKLLQAPLTKEQLAELFQVPQRGR